MSDEDLEFEPIKHRITPVKADVLPASKNIVRIIFALDFE
jgi:hypothetical protein